MLKQARIYLGNTDVKHLFKTDVRDERVSSRMDFVVTAHHRHDDILEFKVKDQPRISTISGFELSNKY